MNPVKLFEKEFKKFLDVKHARAVSNGTAALHSALLATGVGYGDKVITTPFTFIATGNAVLMCGATPVFADINPDTCCLNPLEVEKQLRIHHDAKAILAVHLFGNMANVLKLKEIAEDNNLVLVEDSSQALGANFNGRMAGTFGDAGTFSFYASKNLWTFEGGMVVTNDDAALEGPQVLGRVGTLPPEERARLERWRDQYVADFGRIIGDVKRSGSRRILV